MSSNCALSSVEVVGLPGAVGQQHDFSQRAVERTRERIVESAFDLLRSHPDDEVSLDAVASLTGLSRQTIHGPLGWCSRRRSWWGMMRGRPCARVRCRVGEETRR